MKNISLLCITLLTTYGISVAVLNKKSDNNVYIKKEASKKGLQDDLQLIWDQPFHKRQMKVFTAYHASKITFFGATTFGLWNCAIRKKPAHILTFLIGGGSALTWYFTGKQRQSLWQQKLQNLNRK